MKLSTREISLAWMTTAVLVLGATYWFASPRYEEWKELTGQMNDLSDRMQVTERLLDQRDRWDERLDTFRQQLPRHAADKEVTADLLKTIERMMRQHGLIPLNRDPELEESLGDLCEVAIHYTWEGDLEALVRFLYAIQVQGVILDVRQLQVTPVQNEPEKLKGSFTVDCAFSREPGPGANKEAGETPAE